ncbi:BldC family transcriptional regulator [Rhodococcus sp. NPDC057135]|uniref:BldC family transcriptional regulator n=1 Tax=Rhodococcus sp. NPDC057135 TaxID=3346028 RepID=UPI00362F2189
MNAGVIRDDAEHWLTPGQAAALFNVNPKTVTRWAQAGKIGYITTVGGHRRYRSSEIHLLMRALHTIGKARLGADGASATPPTVDKRR